ncbi:hypothetical protein M2164_004057 [Streptomyces sp. SAI-208]|nr:MULTISPECIES: twin-arginine translocation signal domain-containing protein [unclassified Streptomyces]MDH6586178.1 hypothetical protein [Streptomyces sp. SAI-133]MDH6608422.1 hypothetical protein [Streptomyces sp. SAI-208]
MPVPPLDRREFVKKTAVTAAGAVAPNSAEAAGRRPPKAPKTRTR